VFNGQTQNALVTGAWSSFTVQTSDNFAFRAYSQGNGIGLYYDTKIPDCATDMLFVVGYAQPATADSAASQITGVIRVDDSDIHAASFTVGATAMGDAAFIITLNATPEYQRIVHEMDSGQNLRVRFDWPGQTSPVVKTFALNGFQTARLRNAQWCRGTVAAIRKDAAKKKQAKAPPNAGTDL
jgi:Golgi nucleoside diphosphatase